VTRPCGGDAERWGQIEADRIKTGDPCCSGAVPPRAPGAGVLPEKVGFRGPGGLTAQKADPALLARLPWT
jgi:hypothetical protein